MAGELEKIMDILHPSELTLLDAKHDTARAKFILNSTIVGNYLEYDRIIVSYFRHHLTEIGEAVPVSPEKALAEAKACMKDGGMDEEEAVHRAMSGEDGGMASVLTAISEGLKKRERAAKFEFVMNAYVNPLEFSQKVELMRELATKLIAGGTRKSYSQISPEELAGDYKRWISEYIQEQSKFKHIRRTY
jgi:hypothetical protein